MAVRCTAHRTNGEPCGNYAMTGGRVCHAHGGRAPAVRKAAQRRLLEARMHKEIAELLTESDVQREALKPWLGELGPRYVWDWKSPSMLRRVAVEMRRVASELTALASTTNGRD